MAGEVLFLGEMAFIHLCESVGVVFVDRATPGTLEDKFFEVQNYHMLHRIFSSCGCS